MLLPYRMELIKKLYFRSCGYSYTNLGRLFLRLFVGMMLLQFGVRQWLHFSDTANAFPQVWFMSPEAACIVMIIIEILCSLFIMFGFLTRLMTLPPFIAMLIAEIYLMNGELGAIPEVLVWALQQYVPVMFMGIYFFLMLVGPGKISVDYFLSLHIIHTENRGEDELEEV